MADKTSWRAAGESLVSCNCAWGCPCQFNALPTTGRCEAFAGFRIESGVFGKTVLDGVRFAVAIAWPGPIHEGNGTIRFAFDAGASAEQRSALAAMSTGKQGGSYFEIFNAVSPNHVEPLVAPIEFEIDRERRTGRVRIPGFGESRAEPIKNPATGEEHRARIVLPTGFEYREAEMGNTVELHVHAGARLDFQHQNTYAQLNRFDWSNA